MPGGFIINAFAAKSDELAAYLSERVDLYWRRRDITVPLRVKILACGDRAKAQTAATLQDINTLRRAFKRTLHSIRRAYASEHSVFFFFYHFRGLPLLVRLFYFFYFLLVSTHRRQISCRFSGDGVRLHGRDTTTSERVRCGAVRRIWRTARLDIYIIL